MGKYIDSIKIQRFVNNLNTYPDQQNKSSGVLQGADRIVGKLKTIIEPSISLTSEVLLLARDKHTKFNYEEIP